MFISLSIGLNLAIAYAVTHTSLAEVKQPQILQLNLMSLHKPVVTSTPQHNHVTSSKPKIKKTVTQANAKNTIAMSNERHVKEQTTQMVNKVEIAQDLKTVAEGSQENNPEATVIREAKYRYQKPPVYPSRALDLGQQGTVTIHAKVMTDGKPKDLKVANSSGHHLLDLAALSAVKKWEFEPMHENGHMIAGWVRVPVRFVIQK